MQNQKVVVRWCDSPNSFRMKVTGQKMKVTGQKRMSTRKLIIYITLGGLGALLIGLSVGPSIFKLIITCIGIVIILIATRFVSEDK